jgi:hypothetical protein
MIDHTSIQAQRQNDRDISDSFILSKIADIPSEATRFLSDPKEYAKEHGLQLSNQTLAEIKLMVSSDIPSECHILQSRNPFLRIPISAGELAVHSKYQPNKHPVVTMSAGMAAALGAGAAALVGGLVAAVTSASKK